MEKEDFDKLEERVDKLEDGLSDVNDKLDAILECLKDFEESARRLSRK